jgi:thiol-disulfide isomerase/thioredoxin
MDQHRSISVTLLTQTDCGYCDDAKEVLGRLAGEYPLRVSTVDLATPMGQQLAADGGVMFPPGIFVDGEPFSYGRPSERKLRKALARRQRLR